MMCPCAAVSAWAETLVSPQGRTVLAVSVSVPSRAGWQVGRVHVEPACLLRLGFADDAGDDGMQVWRFLLIAAAVVFCAACDRAGEQAGSACPVDDLLNNWADSVFQDNDVVIFGEIHGTREAPELFYRVVCSSLGRDGPVVVGLEIPESAISDVRSVARPDLMRDALSASNVWAKAHDGRTSVANFELIAKLLELEANGKIKLIGFDTRRTGRESFGRDAGDYVMGGIESTGRKTRAVLLTGRGHADFSGGENSISNHFSTNGYRTLVVDIRSSGGEAWICRMGVCGVSPAPDNNCGEVSGVPSSSLEIDGIKSRAAICVGRLHASAPMVSE